MPAITTARWSKISAKMQTLPSVRSVLPGQALGLENWSSRAGSRTHTPGGRMSETKDGSRGSGSPGDVACAIPEGTAAAGRAGGEDRPGSQSRSFLGTAASGTEWLQPSDWRICAECSAVRVSGAGSRRNHAPRLLPPRCASRSRTAPTLSRVIAPPLFRAASPPRSASGPRSPARPRALLRPPALSARARRPDDAGAARAGSD